MYLLAWGCYSQAHGSMPRISYESREGMLAEASCDTSRMIPDVMLKDVIVRGQLVQMKTDRIIYHVDADSSAMKENLIETLRKMPGLIVSRKGEISADDNRKIVYKLNGLRDPLVNNPIELLSALNSKYVKKVELVTHPDLQYGNDAVVLNITTKGRLEGYMLTMYGKGTDSSLFGSIWGTSKIKRIRFSACYSFNDMFGHSSTSRSEELRHEVLVDHMSITEGKIGGTSSKDHNMELSASYDVDDHSLLSAYARIFLRNNMHSSSRYDVQVTQADNSPSYSYVKQLNHRLKSPEYQASLNYERVFGPGGEGGKFFVGYNYYGRPYMEKKEICYQDIDSVAGCANSISGLMDCLLMTSSGEDWHTCELEYNRRVGKHHLFVFGLKGLLRLDHDDNEEKYSPIGLGYYRDNTEVSLCKRTQNFLQSSLGYTYNGRKWRISAGLQYENDWEKLARADKGYTYKVSFCDFLPSMGISYILSDRGTLSLGYAMSVSRPNIFALDPYVDSSIVNELSYGNPGLKPQRNQDISLTTAFRMGSGDAWYLSMSLAHQYSDRLLLGYSYLAGSVLHTTKDNIGHKNNTNLELSLRKRFGGYWWLPLPILQNTILIAVNQPLADFCFVTQNQRGTKTGQNHGKIKSRTLRPKYPLWNTSVSFAKVQICPLKNEGKSLFLSFTTHFPTIVPQMWLLQTVLTSNSMTCENRVLNFVLHSDGHFQKRELAIEPNICHPYCPIFGFVIV